MPDAMETSTHTEEFTRASEPPSADVVGAAVNPSLAVSVREQCSACGAAMASDQRYCVECGQRRGPARVPLMEGLAQPAREAPATRRASLRPRMSVDSTLIAGIGTLLLAMGIGVLIGRSGNSSSPKSPRVQVVTVAGGGGAASSGAATSAAATPSATGASATSTKSGGAHTTAASAPSASKKATAPPPKTVTVGSPGHGPGYKNGHFTGNFFGE
jgi:hypothetical protein